MQHCSGIDNELISVETRVAKPCVGLTTGVYCAQSKTVCIRHMIFMMMITDIFSQTLNLCFGCLNWSTEKIL